MPTSVSKSQDSLLQPQGYKCSLVSLLQVSEELAVTDNPTVAIAHSQLMSMHPIAADRSPCRYVPGGEYMNVNSGVQIRQLLFPDSCNAPTKTFRALNPEYDLDPRPKGVRRYIDFTLHGLWGSGVRSTDRLTVEAETKKGMAAVSSAVLWSLAGKPGAAAKALAELQAQQQELVAASTASQNKKHTSSDDSRLAVSLHGGDGLDDFELHNEDDEYHLETSAAVAAGSVDTGVHLSPAADVDPEEEAALEQEAKKWKLGKMFVAMAKGKGEEGKREGIEACLALEKLIEVREFGLLRTAGSCLACSTAALLTAA